MCLAHHICFALVSQMNCPWINVNIQDEAPTAIVKRDEDSQGVTVRENRICFPQPWRFVTRVVGRNLETFRIG